MPLGLRLCKGNDRSLDFWRNFLKIEVIEPRGAFARPLSGGADAVEVVAGLAESACSSLPPVPTTIPHRGEAAQVVRIAPPARASGRP